jgi:hypothetical protein
MSMCPLRRVEDVQAGPAAVGILVPPARRTFVILRPRTLAWDLVLLGTPDGSTFRDMSPLEAEMAAYRLYRALDAWSGGGDGRLEEVASPQGRGFWLRAVVGPFALLACPRLPGQPYRPQDFGDARAARAAAAELLAVLRPPPGVEQECYLNTRHFGR